jgi:hypothetical protein
VSYVLPLENQLAVLAALVDGNSERGAERITERVKHPVTRKTIGKLALSFGTSRGSVKSSRPRDRDRGGVCKLRQTSPKSRRYATFRQGTPLPSASFVCLATGTLPELFLQRKP